MRDEMNNESQIIIHVLPDNVMSGPGGGPNSPSRVEVGKIASFPPPPPLPTRRHCRNGSKWLLAIFTRSASTLIAEWAQQLPPEKESDRQIEGRGGSLVASEYHVETHSTEASADSAQMWDTTVHWRSAKWNCWVVTKDRGRCAAMGAGEFPGRHLSPFYRHCHRRRWWWWWHCRDDDDDDYVWRVAMTTPLLMTAAAALVIAPAEAAGTNSFWWSKRCGKSIHFIVQADSNAVKHSAMLCRFALFAMVMVAVAV